MFCIPFGREILFCYTSNQSFVEHIRFTVVVFAAFGKPFASTTRVFLGRAAALKTDSIIMLVCQLPTTVAFMG